MKHRLKVTNAIIIFVITFIACEENTPDPPQNLYVTSVSAGATPLLHLIGVQSPVDSPFIVNFSTPINETTVTDGSVSIKQKEKSIPIEYESFPESIIIKPIKILLVNTKYILEIKNSILSKEGVSLVNNFTFEITTYEPEDVYINNVVDAPTSEESITLKNNRKYEANISNWLIVNKNTLKSYKIPLNTIIPPGQFLTIDHDSLDFEIEDENAELHLSAGGIISYWYN
jgi:Lamin Tail Domain